MTTNETIIVKLGAIEDRINDHDSIVARWEFGRVLLEQKEGSQLPKGLRAHIAKEFLLESTEITRRMKLAETYANKEEVMHACTTYGSWRRIVREELTKARGKPSATPWEQLVNDRLRKIVDEADTQERREVLRKLLNDYANQLEG